MQRFVQVQHSTYVIYHSTYVQWQTAFWHASAGNHLYHCLLIASRIEGWHFENFDISICTVDSSF